MVFAFETEANPVQKFISIYHSQNANTPEKKSSELVNHRESPIEIGISVLNGASDGMSWRQFDGMMFIWRIFALRVDIIGSGPEYIEIFFRTQKYEIQ